MPLSSLFFKLCVHLLLYAIVCMVSYFPLRLVWKRCPVAIYWLGAISLGLWIIILGIDGALYTITFDGMPLPYPVANVAREIVTLLVTLGIGGVVMHSANRKQGSWQQGALFFSLYFGVIHIVVLFLALWTREMWPLSYIELLALPPLSLFSWSSIVSAAIRLLIYFFPLGAPLAEIGVNNFRGAFVANRDGHPVCRKVSDD